MAIRFRLAGTFAVAAFLFLESSVHAARISAEAQRHFDRGTAAMEIAKVPQDYTLAIGEFEQAVQLAPEWPKAYYNLGLAQQKAGKFKDAASSFQQYLQISPHARNAAAAHTRLNKDQFKAEQTITDADARAIFVSLGKLEDDFNPNGQSRWRMLSVTTGDATSTPLVGFLRLSPGLDGDIIVSTKFPAPISTMDVVPHRKTLRFKFEIFVCEVGSATPDRCPTFKECQFEIRSKREIAPHVHTVEFLAQSRPPSVFDEDFKFVPR